MQAYFRISHLDAELLVKESFAGLYAEPPGWETYIQELQGLPQRVCLVKNKIEGGVVIIRTLDVEENETMTDEIGSRYLRKREEVEREYRARREALVASNEPESFRERKIQLFNISGHNGPNIS